MKLLATTVLDDVASAAGSSHLQIILLQ